MQRMIIRLARRAFLLALIFIAPLALLNVFAPHIAPGSKYFGHVAAAQSANVGFDKGLLWRVEKPGAASSYLFGTIHVADKRVTAVPEAVRKQLDAAKSFTMEVALDQPNITMLAARMVYADGRDLPGVAGEELFRKAVPLMAGYGVPPELLRSFKPWAVMLMLAVPQQQQPENVLDFVLYRMASRQGKPLHYLETVDDQVAAFEGMPEADQVALLKHTVETHHELPATTRKLLEAYLQRDLGLMWQINEAEVKDRPELKPLNEVFAQRLLYDRNVRMVERMQLQLREGNAFIAVGALHLYGGRGLLSLLQSDGYRVSRVY
jgi:uncharacterized protein YbaP (TraB family)